MSEKPSLPESGKSQNKLTPHPTYIPVTTKSSTSAIRPPMYQVWLLNDDCTPMDFVVLILKKFFHKPEEEAHATMLHIHQEGQGICGIFTRETAESKVIQVTEFARTNAYPLKCIMRKEQSYVIKKS